jgi:integrase
VHDICDSELIGLILRRQPSGYKSWHYGYTFGGRRHRVKIGDFPALTVEGARKAATQPAAEVAMGINPAAKKREARAKAKQQQQRTLGKFLEGPYRKWAEAHMKAHRPTLDALEADFGNGNEEGHKKGAGWWDLDMDQITVSVIEDWRIEQIKFGNQPTTINRAWQRLRAVLGKAVAWKVIAGPPPCIKRLKTDRRGRVRFLSEAEWAALFRALDDRDWERRERRESRNQWLRARHREPLPSFGLFTDYLQPLTRLFLASGLRHSEGLCLRWGELDFENDLINVRGMNAKNAQSRAVPMTSDVRATLLAWRAQHPDWAAEKLVFPNRAGGRILRITAAWRGLMKRARIANFRVHDTRHDYASRLAMKGVELLTIARLLGHEDISMVLRYAHLSPHHLRDAMRRLDPPPTPAAFKNGGPAEQPTDTPDNNSTAPLAA